MNYIKQNKKFKDKDKFISKRKKEEHEEVRALNFLTEIKQECFTEDHTMFVIEVPVREHDNPEVKEAKLKEIDNLRK